MESDNTDTPMADTGQGSFQEQLNATVPNSNDGINQPAPVNAAGTDFFWATVIGAGIVPTEGATPSQSATAEAVGSSSQSTGGAGTSDSANPGGSPPEQNNYAVHVERDGIKRHIELDTVCGICTGFIGIGKPTLILKGKKDGAHTEDEAITDTFAFPDLSHSSGKLFIRGVGELCTRLTCRDNHQPTGMRPQCVTAHAACLEILRKICKQRKVKWDRKTKELMWVVAAWRKPGPTMGPTRLSVGLPPMVDTKILSRLCRASGMPEMASMPVEILQNMYQFSLDAVFWRPLRVAGFLDTVMGLKVGPTMTLNFTTIEAWERDQPVFPYQSLKLGRIVRATVDAYGIEKVERLPAMPEYTGAFSSNRLYIVGPASGFDGSATTIRAGRMQMGGKSVPFLWNTPTPFHLESVVACPNRAQTCSRLYAIEIGQIEGLTFFLKSGTILSIHIHYRGQQQSSALSTFNRIGHQDRRDTIWFFVPFHESDRLTKFESRVYMYNRRVILLRTEMLGEIVMGVPGFDLKHKTEASSATSLTLVYGHNKDDKLPVPFFGVLDKERKTPVIGRQGSKWSRATIGRLYAFASADKNLSMVPLANVVSVTAFYMEASDFVRGIMFTYADGGQRTLGQCRVGVDRCKTFDKPGGLCFTSFNFTLQVKPRCDRCKADGMFHADSRYKCAKAPMSGLAILRFVPRDEIMFTLWHPRPDADLDFHDLD